MKVLSIDRFEGNFAICQELDTGKLFGIERQELPKKAREGDVLEISEEGEISINEEMTRQRRQKITSRQKSMFGK